MLAAACTQPSNTWNCETDKCEMIGQFEICTQCKTEKVDGIPVNGFCWPPSSHQAVEAGCTGGVSAGICGKCSGSGFFLFRGGCYKAGQTPGSEICTAASEGKCTTCKTDSGLFKNPATTVTPGNECILCSDATSRDGVMGVENCNTCTAPNSAPGTATCSACQEGFYKDDNICIKCDPGYFLNGQGACQKCDTSCATCDRSEIHCTSCPWRNYLKIYQCVEERTCERNNRFYADPVSRRCIACNMIHEQCIQCSFDNDNRKPQCLSCGSNGYILKTELDGTVTCIAENDCPLNGQAGDYFLSDILPSGDKKCIACNNTMTKLDQNNQGINNCKTCMKNSKYPPTCSICQDGYYLNGYGCFLCGENCKTCSAQNTCSACLDGYFLDSGSCIACAANCATCTSANINDCTVCLPRHFLKTDGSAKECVPCNDTAKGGIDGCSECSGTAGSLTCTWCRIRYRPFGDPSIGFICVKICEDATMCTDRDATYGGCDAWIVNTTGEILYYCSHCVGGSRVPINGLCVDENSANNQGHICNSGICRACAQGYFLHKGSCYAIGQFPGNLVCADIQASGIAGVCTTCVDGYYKNPRNSPTANSCIACGGPACATCSGTTWCTSCRDGDRPYLMKEYDNIVYCVSEVDCNGQYFPTIDGNNMRLCSLCSNVTNGGIQDCSSCLLIAESSRTGNIAITCTNCGNKNVGLGENSCIDSCPPNSLSYSYDYASKCKCEKDFTPNADFTECIVASDCNTLYCKTCDNKGTTKEVCTACISNYYLTPTNQCINRCDNIGNYYGGTDDSGKKVCKKCKIEGCLQCADDGYCTACDYYGFFNNYTSGVCQKCDPSCEQCIGETAGDCISCFSGKILQYGRNGDRGTCIPQCTIGIGQGKCKVCGLTIEGTAYCSVCATPTEYPQNGVCAPKTTRTTDACNDASITGGVCKQCADGFFLMNGGCYTISLSPGWKVCYSTSDGICRSPNSCYHIDNNNNLVTCSEGCETCTDSSHCTACMSWYVKTGDSCTRCPEGCEECSDAHTCITCMRGYFKTSYNTCAKCDKNCAECTEAACSRCYFGYYLDSAKNSCIKCSRNSSNIQGIPNCANCVLPPNDSGPVICYLINDGTNGDNDDPSVDSGGLSLSSGAIAGLSIVVIVVIGGLVGFLCWWFVYHSKKKYAPA